MRYILALILLLINISFSMSQTSNDFSKQISNIQNIKDRELLTLMLKSFLYSQDLENAYKVAKQGVKTFPNDPFWIENAAKIALWLNKPEEALQFYKRLYPIKKSQDIKEKILQLSLQTYEYQTAVEIIEEKLKEGNLKLLKDYFYIIRILGEHERAYTVLKALYKKYKSPEILRYLAYTAHVLGYLDEAIKYYEALTKTNISTPDDFYNLSNLYLSKKNFEKALDTLLKGYQRFGDRVNEDYIRLIVSVSAGIKKDQITARFLKKIVDEGKGDIYDYIKLYEIYKNQGNFKLALKYIKEAYKKYKREYLAKAYINTLFLAGNTNEILEFFSSLPKEEKNRLLQNDYILYAYISSLEKAGRYKTVIKIYENLLKTDFSAEKLEDFLFTLIKYQQYGKLKFYLNKYRKLAKNEEKLWPIFSLGYLTFQDTRHAKYFLEKLIKKDKNLINLTMYADLLEISGQTDRALFLRKRLWDKIKNRHIENKNFIEQYLTIASYFVSPKVYFSLLEKYKNQLDKNTYWNLKYSYLLRINAHDKVFYLSRKYRYLKPWMEMNLALTFDDRTWQKELLEKKSEFIPIRDRVDAAVRTGQIGLAKELAFRGLSDNPEDYLLYLWLRDLYMDYSGKFALSSEFYSGKRIQHTYFKLDYRYPLKNRTYFLVNSSFKIQNSVDTNNYINVPETDTQMSLGVKYLLDRGYITLKTGIRDALRNFPFISLTYNHYTKDRVYFETEVFFNKFADETIYLWLGGMKSGIELRPTYVLNNRTFINFQLGINKYKGQDNTDIGNGIGLYSEVYYKLRVSYPDFSFRTYISTYAFSERSGNKGAIQNLSPYTNTRFLPDDFVETGIEFSFGYDNRYLYTRTSRPFFKVGLTYNTITRFGYYGELGYGSITSKKDNLAIGIGFYRGYTGLVEEMVNLFVEYRRWF